MLKLNNVSKTYLSKGKQRVEALKDVNLEIGDRGLVFILGKSGSGKSTLLNILGGIDGATGGEIFVDNQSFANFKQADYDNYRNSYVGFVFQEFNLLNDFDVAGNVALALKLSGETEISDKVKNALQSVGLSADYLTRKIDELSGGEKQRVAIARAIVKESKLILADEPTGNLDSATGESIWNIIKGLSAEKLVIVVTHDRESAEKYGDRIIEISDGEIIADSGEQPESKGEQQVFAPKRKSLSNAVCLRMGANNLLQRKVKTVSVTLLAVLTTCLILVSQILLSFSSERSIAKFVRDNDVEYIELMQGTTREGYMSSNYFMYPDTAEYIENNTTYIKEDVIECKQDVYDMGWSFVGEALELDDKSFYITAELLEEFYSSLRIAYVEVDGKPERVKRKHPVEFLIGKKFATGSFSIFDPLPDQILAGVIDTSMCSSLCEHTVKRKCGDYAKSTFEGRRESHVRRFNTQTVFTDFILQFGGVKYAKQFAPYTDISDVTATNGKILTEQGLQDSSDVKLADNEIVLSFELYSELFHGGVQGAYVNSDLTEVLSIPKYLGRSFPFKINEYALDEYGTNHLLCDAGELKIAGIGFSDSTYEPCFTAGKNTILKINSALRTHRYLVKVSSIDNLEKFLLEFRKEHNGYVSFAGEYEVESFVFGNYWKSYSSIIYGYENGIRPFKILFSAIAATLSVILLLLVMNLVSFSIMSRKKEIGILSALGATNRDLTKIFLFETLLISVVTFVLNFVAVFAGTAGYNSSACAKYPLEIMLFRVDIFTIITLVAASFGLLLLAALIPIRKIIKLKPIDAIKNL